MKKIRVGVSGCGAISGTHLASLTKHGGFEVSALCDVRPEAAEARRNEFGLSTARVFENFEGFLAEGEMEAVVICTPPEEHARQSIASLEAHKHVLCEKPMAMDAPEARRMAGAVEESGRVFLLDHRYLFDSLLAKAIDVASAPAFGRAHRLHLWAGNVTDPIRRPGIYQAGGGCLGDMAYHGIYYALRLLGRPESVYAVARTLKYETPLDDNCVLILRYERALATLDFSFTQVAGLAPRGRPFMILGDRQSLYVDANEYTLRLHPDDVEMAEAKAPWTDPLAAHFHECVTGDQRPVAGAAEGVEAMEVLDAARTSAQSGEAVRL